MKDLFAQSIEIGSLKEAKKMILENLRSFEKLFNCSPACMSLTTPERRYVKVNDKFLGRFGYSKTEVIGFTSSQVGILDPQESEKVGALLKEKGKLQNDMVLCRTKTGELVYTLSSIEKIEIAGKTYFLSSFLDMTKIIEQQQVIEQQHKEILDSINYARLIQNSILPSQDQIEEILPESFVLAKPKNIVSGDFYWIKKLDDKIFVSACDCTGHGVPGALISIVGYKLLSKFTGEYRFSKPAEILNQLNKEFTSAVQKISNNEIKDGMDIALCTINKLSMTMEYAGAYNPIYLVRNGELMKLKVDKIPVHLFTSYSGQEFNNYEIKIEPGDCVYLFSDGYADQFGGPDGKKFQYKQFQKLILEVHQLPMQQQKEIFDKTIEEWRNESGEEQTDDMLVVGFKI
ncbi:MAG: domain S-box protein [Bacteroidetes bacterium]|nr:domain S-box protein [Bacteroidota bacterium]